MADGVIVGQAGHPDIVRHVHRNVEAGARAAGRNLADVDVWFTCRIYVCDRPNGAIYTDGLDEYGARQARYFWRTAGSPSADEVVDRIEQRKGIRLPEEIARRLVAYNLAFDHANAWSGSKVNVELLDRYELRDWAGRMFYISGTVDDVAARVRQLDGGRGSQLLSAGDHRRSLRGRGEYGCGLRSRVVVTVVVTMGPPTASSKERCHAQ